MAAVSTYSVVAAPWEHGWELHIRSSSGHVGVTQSRTLAAAVEMVRDYLRLDGQTGWADAHVSVELDLGGLEKTVHAIREEITAAADAQARAAKHSRELAIGLRERGLSVSDMAAVLGVSRGRVSQLVRQS